MSIAGAPILGRVVSGSLAGRASARAGLVLAAIGPLACWRPVDGAEAPEAPPAPTIAVDPLLPATLAHLEAPQTLYWRAADRRCEAWSYTPAGEDEPARLERRIGGPRSATATLLAFRATLRGDALFLTAPTHEIDGRSTALPCTFSGQLVREGARTLALELGSETGLYLGEDACIAGGAPPIRPLGCAEALADPITRAHLDARARAAIADAPAAEEPPGPPLRWPDGRVVVLRIAGEDGPVCTRWRRIPAEAGRAGGPDFGLLRRRVGDVVQSLEYRIDGRWLTLASPTIARREQGLEVRRSRSCLVSLEALAGDRRSLALGALSWHRSRRACEAEQEPLEAPPACLAALLDDELVRE